MGTAGAALSTRPVLERTSPDDVSTSVKGSLRCRKSSAPLSDGVAVLLSSAAGAVLTDVTASAARCFKASSWAFAWLFATSS